jgi:hypothetical protein
MTQDHGPGRPWSPEGYSGFGEEPEAEQDHIRKLAARQRKRAARMRAEAAELRARNRRLRQGWPPASNGGIQRLSDTTGTDEGSPTGSSDC